MRTVQRASLYEAKGGTVPKPLDVKATSPLLFMKEGKRNSKTR